MARRIERTQIFRDDRDRDSFVHRLRRYVEKDPSRPRHIVSVRGHGYRFVR